MDIPSLIISSSKVLNPMLLKQNLHDYAVLPFFIANISLLVFLICMNKEIKNFIKGFFIKMPGYVRIAVIILIITHIFVIFNVMNPINALTYPGFADMYSAKYLLVEGRISPAANPYGLPIVLAMLQGIFGVDPLWAMVGLTALLSLIIIMLMMFVTLKVTKNYDAIFFAPILFIFSNIYLSQIPGVASILASIASIILFAFICSFKINEVILPAILATTILPYFRMENFSLIFLFILMLIVKRYWMGWKKALLLYVMFMPHFAYISNTNSIINYGLTLIGSIGLIERISVYSIKYTIFFGGLLIPLAWGLYLNREYIILPMATVGQFLTYILYQGSGTHVSEHYMLNLLGLTTLLAGIGIFRITRLAERYNKVASAIFILFLIFHLQPTIAPQETHMTIAFNQNASTLVNGTRYILYGHNIYLDTFGRFYNPSTILLLDKEERISKIYSDYDYVVFLAEFNASAEDLKSDLSLRKVNNEPFAMVFKIEKP